MRFLFFTIIFVLLGGSGFAGVRSALDAIKIITVNSTHQKILEQNIVQLDGDVELLLDYKVHIFADHVRLDKESQTISARADEGGFVKIENSDFVMLADSIDLQLAGRTGCAKNIKIHVKEGFISSAKAEKIDDKTWYMQGLTYTSCDHTTPHWSFAASHATLYKNSVLKASGLFFKINNVPIFVFPALLFPLQNRAGSGLLMPRLSFDAVLGFGFRQEYYWLLSNHCDTTIGFNLVQKKGFIVSDEFRWAQSPENYVVVDSHYAEEWRAWIYRNEKIVKATDRQYWIQGKYFQPSKLGSLKFQNLVQFDFGTDKRIGYHFLNDAHLVEDSFHNSVIQRYHDRKHLMQFMMDSERSLRKQFVSCCKSCEKKEREEKTSVTYLPHYEWNTGYYEMFDHPQVELFHMHYRHDLLCDHAFLESRNVERKYCGPLVDTTTTTTPRVDSNTFRFIYRGRLRSSLKLFDQHFMWFIEPHAHFRSNTKSAKSCYKIFARCGAEWAFPERMLYTENYRYVHYLQPFIRWTYLPKFHQKHWYHIDKYDRIYPENRLEFSLRNSWLFDEFSLNLQVSQAYDFHKREEIFPLRRGYGQKRCAPLSVHAQCFYKNFHAQVTQEYDWKSFDLAQLEVMASLSSGECDFSLGYLYQKNALRRERELFSDIPTFATVGCSIPIGKSIRIHYDGKFYSKEKSAFPFFNALKPMLHHFHLDYSGHCWGISLGWEEKRYRQYGNWKSERAITLAIRLQSIGSFAQKFKRFPIYHAPEGYLG